MKPNSPKPSVPVEKVYFIAGTFDVKLQADNRVRWDVVLRD
jgi:hypothetical protein